MRMLRALAIVCALAHASTADAREILFIDLNNATSEIRAIRESLAVGDRLHVVPSSSALDEKRRGEILRVSREIERITKQATECKSKGRVFCERTWATLRDLNLARDELTKRYGSDALIADIRALSPDTGFDTIVVSGHHSGSYFRGELAQFEANDLLRFDIELARETKNVRTLLLLGCETGTPALMGDLFVKALPSLQLIVGAEDNAPTRDETRNLAFIRKFVREENVLLESKSHAEVLPRYREFLKAAWPVSMLWRRTHFYSRDWQGSIDAMPATVAATFKRDQSTVLSTIPAPPLVAAREAPTPQRETLSRAQRIEKRDAFAPMHTPREAIEILNSRNQ
jgi:hypothetical protein